MLGPVVGADDELLRRAALAARTSYDVVLEREQMTTRLTAARTALAQAVRELARLEQVSEDEAADVSRLESVTLARVWATVVGSRDADLASERGEARLAGAEADDAYAAADRLRTEVAVAEASLAGHVKEHPDAEVRLGRDLDTLEQRLRHRSEVAAPLRSIAGETRRVDAERTALTALDNEARSTWHRLVEESRVVYDAFRAAGAAQRPGSVFTEVTEVAAREDARLVLRDLDRAVRAVLERVEALAARSGSGWDELLRLASLADDEARRLEDLDLGVLTGNARRLSEAHGGLLRAADALDAFGRLMAGRLDENTHHARQLVHDRARILLAAVEPDPA
ncbi:MAG: hypothetical protein CMH83_18475 [Nocardioides sp.]|nr:hypothetical protein [Nocardioides sp.]